MERESFENEEVAKIMNDNFVNIKVDREERPDIDKVYMTFVQVREGFQKKISGKVWSFTKPLSDSPFPPVWSFSPQKNFPPFCLLKNASLMAETNFTLGPISKTIKFPF